MMEEPSKPGDPRFVSERVVADRRRLGEAIGVRLGCPERAEEITRMVAEAGLVSQWELEGLADAHRCGVGCCARAVVDRAWG